MYHNVYQFPYDHMDGKMLEALTLATLHSRIELWGNNHYGLQKSSFSLIDLLGWDSLNNGDEFKAQIHDSNIGSSNNNGISTVPNYTFPTRQIDAFKAEINFTSSNLSELEVTSIDLHQPKKHLNLFTYPNHLILNCGTSKNFIDILVILRGKFGFKSLALVIQLKDYSKNSDSSAFDLHNSAEQTLNFLKTKFKPGDFNHLVLIASTLYRASAIQFIRSIQNGGSGNTIYDSKEISKEIIGIATMKNNSDAFSAFLPTYFSRYLLTEDPTDDGRS